MKIQLHKVLNERRMIANISCLFLFLGFLSCEKYQADIFHKAEVCFQDLVLEIKDDILHFKDKSEFTTFLQKYQNDKNEWENVSAKFMSMEKYIDMIPESELEEIIKIGDVGKYDNQLIFIQRNNEEYLEPKISSFLFRSIANENSDFVIGDTLIHLEHDRVLYIPLKDFREPGSYEVMAKRIEKIEKRIIPSKLVRSNQSKGEVYCNSSSGTRRRKLEASLEEHKIANAQFFIFSVRHYKRGLFGRWKGEKAREMSINGNIDMYYTLYPHTSGSYLTHKYYDETLQNSKEFNDLILQKDYYNYITPYVKHLNWEGTMLNLKADEINSGDCVSHNSVEFDWSL